MADMNEVDINKLNIYQLINVINCNGADWVEDGQYLLALVRRYAGPWKWLYDRAGNQQDYILRWVQDQTGEYMQGVAADNDWDLPLFDWFVKAAVYETLTGELKGAFD